MEGTTLKKKRNRKKQKQSHPNTVKHEPHGFSSNLEGLETLTSSNDDQQKDKKVELSSKLKGLKFMSRRKKPDTKPRHEKQRIGTENVKVESKSVKLIMKRLKHWEKHSKH